MNFIIPIILCNIFYLPVSSNLNESNEKKIRLYNTTEMVETRMLPDLPDIEGLKRAELKHKTKFIHSAWDIANRSQ